MTGRSQQQRLLTRYAKHSRLLGWILFLAALIIITLGIWVIDGDLGTLLAAVGGALMPPALVNAWLDPALREDAARDMKELLDIREDLVSTGFQDASPARTFLINELARRTTRLDLLPLQVDSWKNRDFAEVVSLCSRFSVTVRLYLPAPDEPWCEVIAHRSNLDAKTVASSLRDLPDQLLNTWELGDPKSGSSLEIFYYDGVPSLGLIRSDNGSAVEFGPAVRDEPIQIPGHVFSFESDSAVDKWVEKQFTWREGRPPVSAGMRPLPPTPQPEMTDVSSASTPVTEVSASKTADPSQLEGIKNDAE